jgi:transposase
VVADDSLVSEASTIELEMRELRAKNDVLERQLSLALRDNQLLRARLEAELRRHLGSKADKIDPNQLEIPFEELMDAVLADSEPEPAAAAQEASDAEEAPAAPSASPKRKGAHGRKPLPPNLTRVRVEHHPEDKHCAQCQHEMQPMGSEVTEELDWQPACFYVTEHVRVKYSCRHCQECVAIAALPPRAIEKGRPGPGLLAHVLVSKYADHQPLNRMESILARHGIEISRSTMCDWVRDSAQLLWPIVKALKQSVLRSMVLHADATGVLCQENSKSKRTRKAQLWAWVGDKQEVVYDFTLTKEQAEPKRFLGQWSGHLQCDAASNFHQVFESGAVIEVGCWAHARRRFVDALASDTARASRILALVQMLYKVEAEAREHGLDPPAKAALRQARSRPILERIREEVELAGRTVLPKSALGDAIGYVRNQWRALNRFVEDGRLAIDNNAAERALRGVAVGRKNWLFAGSEDGGKRAATIYSLIGTCKLLGVEPFAYLRDVLERLPTHPASRVEELTPRGWLAARAAR